MSSVRFREDLADCAAAGSGTMALPSGANGGSTVVFRGGEMGTSMKATLSVPQQTGSCQFEIAGFSLLASKQGEKVSSEALINVGGADWGIDVYPRGINAGVKKGYVSAYLRRFGGQGQVKAMYSLTVLSQTGKLSAKRIDKWDFAPDTDRGWHDFIDEEALSNSENGLALNDIVTFEACVTVLGDPVLARVPRKVPVRMLADDIAALRSNDRHSDVTLVAGGRELQAHRLVLVARSPVFDRMFSQESPMREAATGRVEITDVSAEITEQLLEFIYTDGLQNDEVWEDNDAIGALMQAAAKYEVPGLVSLCEQRAMKRLTVENVADWLTLASRIRAEALQDQCVSFMAGCIAEVQSTDGWERLMQDKQLLAELAPLLFKAISPAAKAHPRATASVTIKKSPPTANMEVR